MTATACMWVGVPPARMEERHTVRANAGLGSDVGGGGREVMALSGIMFIVTTVQQELPNVLSTLVPLPLQSPGPCANTHALR